MVFRAAQEKLDGYFVRNAFVLKDVFRIVFGIIWAVDGGLKFQPGLSDTIAGMIADAGSGQPQWLAGWFSFWVAVVGSHPVFFTYFFGVLELSIAFSLILGFARKLGYGAGFLTGLVIWSIPEGFGGPYGPGSTDIGTGIIYSMAFVALAILDATYGRSDYTLDSRIEKRIPWWWRIAEVKGKSDR